jgi:hypothetical protein
VRQDTLVVINTLRAWLTWPPVRRSVKPSAAGSSPVTGPAGRLGEMHLIEKGFSREMAEHEKKHPDLTVIRQVVARPPGPAGVGVIFDD